MILDNFINSPDPIIAQAAVLTKNTIDDLEAGKITKAEYAELMADILDLNAVVKLTSDMQRQNTIAAIYGQLKEIAGAVSSLTSL